MSRPWGAHQSGGSSSRVLGRLAAIALLASPLPIPQAAAQSRPSREASGALSRIDYAYRGWATAGRRWLAKYSGVAWDSHAGKWVRALPNDAANQDVAQQVYFAEYALRPALALAVSQRDVKLLDELAQFYLAFRPRFVQVRQLQSWPGNHDLLAEQGSEDAFVLPWLERTEKGRRVRECQLCTGQFLHPAARLLHYIAEVPASRRSPNMNAFARAYERILVDDYVLRLAYDAAVERYGFRADTRGLIALWSAIASSVDSTRPSYRRAMLDSDLWVLATTAEILAAAKSDSTVIDLGSRRVRLMRIVAAGTRLLATKRHLHSAPTNSTDTLASVSYFDGDFSDHPDMAYAGWDDSLPPRLGDSARAESASWDISHSYRIPVTLRSLSDAQDATHLSYPDSLELRRVATQYVRRAHYHLRGFPLFHSFLDGSDGWYRVVRSATGVAGYPPPRWCDTRRVGRDCLTAGALFGWGQLRADDRDLAGLADEIMDLATTHDPVAVEFRRRYFGFAGQELAFPDTADRERPTSLLLFDVVAESLRESRKAW